LLIYIFNHTQLTGLAVQESQPLLGLLLVPQLEPPYQQPHDKPCTSYWG
jgi:hypothetical protein